MSDELVTYRNADGKPIAGEFDFVMGLEWFDDLDEPIELVRERWVLGERETIVVKPSWWDDLKDDDG